MGEITASTKKGLESELSFFGPTMNLEAFGRLIPSSLHALHVFLFVTF